MRRALLALCFLASFISCKRAPVTIEVDDLVLDENAWLYNEEYKVYYQVGVPYCANPASELETLGIFVPASYFNGTLNDRNLYTCTLNKKGKSHFKSTEAPYVMPIETPGYTFLPPPKDFVPNVHYYTDKGLIFVYAGARGRQSGAPSGVTDFKAAIRFIRHNASLLPGSTNSFYVFGMSGGGAQSAIIGASGNAPSYEPYLNAIGACKESDAVKGVASWCPVTLLDIADASYEWEMGCTRSFDKREDKSLSDFLSQCFAEYINKLRIRDDKGNVLTLSPSDKGIYHKGSYYDYLVKVVQESMNRFSKETDFPYDQFIESPSLPSMNDFKRPIEALDGVSRNKGKIDKTVYGDLPYYVNTLNLSGFWISGSKNLDTFEIEHLDFFMKSQKRAGKGLPAFDDKNYKQPENELFGKDGKPSHFNPFISEISPELQAIMNMYNPLNYLVSMYPEYKKSSVCPNWRIRTGIRQSDTAISTEVLLYLALKNYGVRTVDFQTVWDKFHCEAEGVGNPLDNLIKWIYDMEK